MNEQIKELEKQAVDAVWNLYNYPIGPGTHFRPDGFEEKFAELIVRECMQRLKTTGGEESFYSNKVMNYLDCIEDLKLHFGVEE